MFDKARLVIARDEEYNCDEKTVFIDWWAAGSLDVDTRFQAVVELSLSELESLELDKMERLCFTHFIEILNRYHGYANTYRYWRIVVGAWHQEFFFSLVDRYKRLKASESLAKRLVVKEQWSSKEIEVLRDGSLLPECTGQRAWETTLVSDIIHLAHSLNELTGVVVVTDEDNSDEYAIQAENRPKIPMSFSERLVRVCDPVLFQLGRLSKYEMADTYLSMTEELELRLRLRNLSFLRLGKQPEGGRTRDVDVIKRMEFGADLSRKGQGVLFSVYSTLVFKNLPWSYLEGFRELQLAIEKSVVKFCPRVYFTSNRFGMSDPERIEIAEKVKHGCRYIVAQHGNNYGVTFRPRVLPEEETADRFLRWAPRAAQAATPVGVLTAKMRTPKKYSVSDSERYRVLIVGSQPPTRTFRYYDWDQYFYSEIQTMELVSKLQTMGHQVVFRPYAGRVFGSGSTAEFDRWLKAGKVSIETPKFRDAVSKADLTIFMYDSTGFLELNSRDIPCLQIQKRPLAHVSETFHDVYVRMIDCGLLNSEVDDALGHLDGLTVNQWWESPVRHKVRSEVKERLGKPSRSVVRELTRVIRAYSDI